MNRRGGIMLSVLFGIMIFIFGILFINFLKPDVTTARTALDCSNVNVISDGTKLVCLVTDSVVPYFILILLSAAGGMIFDKLQIG